MLMRQSLGAALLATAIAITAVSAEPAKGPDSTATPPSAASEAKRGTPNVSPAKVLFGAATTPAPLEARSIGFYSRGCLAGAKPLAIDGPAWQAMRLSRNRMWGHPSLVAWVEEFAIAAQKHERWPGLLVGDISQPRGGPMLTGHASHQIGLDADIWFTPMPDRRLSAREREDISATSMLGSKTSVNAEIWSPKHVALIKRAASYRQVERILVHPAIKKALCEGAGGDRQWLSKVRPYWGHHYHFHVRLRCPANSAGCQPQPAVSNDDGCGKELDDWYALLTAPPKPPGKPVPPKPPMTVEQLPPACKVVLEAGSKNNAAAPAKQAHR